MTIRLLLVALATTLPAHALPATPVATAVEETYHDGLEIRFDRPMMTWYGERDGGAVISVAPEVDCRWLWSDDRTLACIDRQPVPRATRFEVRIGPGLASLEGVPMPPTTLEIDTPVASVSARAVEWEDAAPIFELQPSPDLAYDDLVAALELTDQTGGALGFALEPIPERGRLPQWRLRPDGIPPSARELRLNLRPGLRSTEGPLRNEQGELLASAHVNEGLRLRSVSCGRQPDPNAPLATTCIPGQHVRLEFSQALTEAALASLEATLPAGLRLDGMVPPNASRTSGWSVREHRNPATVVSLEVLDAASSWRLELPPGLHAPGGAELIDSPPARITSGDAAATIHDVQARALIDPGSGLPALPMATNIGAGELRVRYLGTASGEVRLAYDAGPLNEPVPLSAHPQLSGALAEGGLVEYELHDGQGWWVALPGWNVVAANGAGQVLAWVLDWETGAPVVGAEVALFTEQIDFRRSMGEAWSEPSAMARTDAQGMARLDPPPVIAGNTRYTLHVASAGRRSVLPFHSQVPGGLRGTGPRTRNLFHWGVADRPLYRAGDTVAFRLWLRERNGNRLTERALDGPVDLRLARQWWGGEQIREWQLEPDAHGRLSGTLTLPRELDDDVYCIEASIGDIPSTGELCFEVSRFDSADTWTRLTADEDVARPGDEITLQASTGFHSGGPAPGAAIHLDALLLPEPLDRAWPEFSNFDFVDVYAAQSASGGRVIAPPREEQHVLSDADGGATVSLQIDGDGDPEIPFGRLLVTADAGYPGVHGATSAPVEFLYAAHERYVGVSVLPRWPEPGDTVRVETVVVDANGERVRDAEVEVVVERIDVDDRPDRSGDEPSAELAPCRRGSGSDWDCGLVFEAGAAYRFTARSAGAIESRVERWTAGALRNTPDRVTLEIEDASPAGDHVRVRIGHPFSAARLLLVLEHEQLLWSSTVRSDEATTVVEVPVDARWAPGATLQVIAVDLDRDGREVGPEDPPFVVGEQIRLPIARDRDPAPLELTIATAVRPGDTAILTLTNPRATAVDAVVSIVDAGLLARVPPEALEALDPWSESGFGGILDHWGSSRWFGFTGWNTSPQDLWLRRDSAGNELQAPPASFAASELDRIEVTGSRILPAELFAPGTAIDPDLPVMQTGSGSALATVRSRFLQTAYWNPGLRLEPGERRELELVLPDNLTRWQVFAWASDDGDGFALSETAFTASLPVEARLQAPVRVFSDDVPVATATARRTSSEPVGPLSLGIRNLGQDVGAAHATGMPTPGQPLLARLTLSSGQPPGHVDLVAEASDATSRDAVMRSVRIASSQVDDVLRQTTWLSGDRVSLALPNVDPDRGEGVLSITVDHVDRVLRAGSFRELRDYPHLCWEQRLARGLAAAMWVDDPVAAFPGWNWPEAASVVEQTLDAARPHLGDDGLFGFFDGQARPRWDAQGHPVLTAWSVRALEAMSALGHPRADEIMDEAHIGLSTYSTELKETLEASPAVSDWEAAAIVAGSIPDEFGDAGLAAILAQWEVLSWFARARLVDALLASDSSPRRQRDLLRRLHAAPGMARIGERATPWTLGSAERDQCAVIEVLVRHDTSPRGQSAAFDRLRGLLDLHAGGYRPSDTQAAAQCLLALAGFSGGTNDDPSAVDIALDGRTVEAQANPAATGQHWTVTGPGVPEALELRRRDASRMPLAVSAELSHRVDAAQAPERAVGLALTREYAVFRAGEWQVLAGGDALLEGDWVRVTLNVDTAAPRHFVALSDPVPGGLVPEDLELAGTSGPALASRSGGGSFWFDARRLDDDMVRLYAESLPPGRHSVHYYARAMHPGRYLAPGASAELMYGRSSFARTAASRLVIDAVPAALEGAQ